MAFGFDTTSDEAAAALSSHIKGKTVIITGAAPGSFGADTARPLAPYEISLLIPASPSAEKIVRVIPDLDIKPSTTVKSLELDLTSQSSVHEAAAKVLQWTMTVDAMIETAGVMAIPSYQVNDEGIELTFAANHLGHFLFTNLIMERLLAGKEGGSSCRLPVRHTSE